MKKLALKLDDLQVDSFVTDDPDDARGTVKGHLSINLCTGGADFSCPCDPDYNYTEWISCGGNSCVNTCTSCNPYGCGSCGH